MTHPQWTARIAGLLYVIVVIGGMTTLTVNSGIIVRGDPNASAANLLADELAFRAGFVANLIASAAYIGVVALLYVLTRPVNRSLAVVAAFFGLAGCAAGAVLSINTLGALLLLTGGPLSGPFAPEQVNALALSAYRLGAAGYNISMTFFGFYCLLLGVLAMRATFWPRIFGVLLAVAGASWLANSLLGYLLPAAAAPLSTYFFAAGALGEIAFTLWLLIMGVNAAKWRAQAAAALPAPPSQSRVAT